MPAQPTAFAARRPGLMVRAALCVGLWMPVAAMAAPVRDEMQAPSASGPAATAPQGGATAAPLAPSAGLDETATVPTRSIHDIAAPADAPTPVAGEPAEVPGRIQSVLQKALALLGTPYRWGGADPDQGFDCSGLVGYVFRNALGIELPRVSRDMARTGELVTDRAKLVAGDLVFFGLKGRINHVGIYLGEGRFLHAPSRGKDVTVSSLEKGYWSGRFLQARRVEGGG